MGPQALGARRGGLRRGKGSSEISVGDNDPVRFTAGDARRIARAVRAVEAGAATGGPAAGRGGPAVLPAAEPLGIVISSAAVDLADPVTHWTYTCRFVRKTARGYGSSVLEPYGELLEDVLNAADHGNPANQSSLYGVPTTLFDPDLDALYELYGTPIPNGTMVGLRLIPVDGAEPEWHIVWAGGQGGIAGACP